jgi:hypothetical protein
MPVSEEVELPIPKKEIINASAELFAAFIQKYKVKNNDQ